MIHTVESKRNIFLFLTKGVTIMRHGKERLEGTAPSRNGTAAQETNQATTAAAAAAALSFVRVRFDTSPPLENKFSLVSPSADVRSWTVSPQDELHSAQRQLAAAEGNATVVGGAESSLSAAAAAIDRAAIAGRRGLQTTAVQKLVNASPGGATTSLLSSVQVAIEVSETRVDAAAEFVGRAPHSVLKDAILYGK